MARKRRKRPNWPYRFAWLSICLALAGYVGLQTVLLASTYGRRAYGTDWGLSFVASLFDTTVAIFFFVVGACIGSFLNVVAYRLPLGRFIGGHSACPYCKTPIDGADNVPFLAWIKLRGRCRECHLPISIQYPLVEISVAFLFAIVYVSEFARGGANLPGIGSVAGFGGVVRVAIDSTLIVRTAVYLFLLSGLVAAALIAVKRRRVPLRLYAWSIAPLMAAALCLPETIIVPFGDLSQSGPVDERVQVLLSLICGTAAGMAIARLLAPLAYRGFDRSLMAVDAQSTQARQFVGAMAVAGCSVGWQSCVSLAWCIVLSGLTCTLVLNWVFHRATTIPSKLSAVNLTDLTVWVWLGLLVFRANWSWLLAWQLLPDQVPEVMRQVLGALLLAPLVWFVQRRSNQSSQ
ncbi:MAG: prepilin peptidase [Aureliella sp.]